MNLLSNPMLQCIANLWVIRVNIRKRLPETPESQPGVILRAFDWAPTKHTHMVQNRIPDCPVVVCIPASVAQLPEQET